MESYDDFIKGGYSVITRCDPRVAVEVELTPNGVNDTYYDGVYGGRANALPEDERVGGANPHLHIMNDVAARSVNKYGFSDLEISGYFKIKQILSKLNEGEMDVLTDFYTTLFEYDRQVTPDDNKPILIAVYVVKDILHIDNAGRSERARVVKAAYLGTAGARM